MNKVKAVLVFLLLMLPVITGISVFAKKGGETVRTDLRYLLPDAGSDAGSAGYFTDRLSGEMLFTFSADERTEPKNDRSSAAESVSGQSAEGSDGASAGKTGELEDAVRSFADKLKTFKFIKVRDFSDMEKTGSFLFAHRYALGADAYLTSGKPDREKLRDEVLGIIYSPFGGATATELARDPFFTMRHYLMREASSGFGMDASGFTFVKNGNGKKVYVISASMDPSGLSSDEGTGFYEYCRNLRLSLKNRNIEMMYTGAFFFTEEASGSSKSDITKISVGSSLMLIVIMLGFFRSVKPLIYGLAVISVSMLSAFGAVLTVFGGMHVISLAMGATLAGISFDYVLHVLVRRARCGYGTPEMLRKALMKPLGLSLVTSVTAYGVTSFTGLNVLKELSLFASVVLVGTFLLSCYVLSLTRLSGCADGGLSVSLPVAVFRRLSSVSPLVSAAVTAAVFMSAVLLILQKGADDDVASLRRNDTELAVMDREVNRIVNGNSSGVWFIMEKQLPHGKEGIKTDDNEQDSKKRENKEEFDPLEVCERFIGTLSATEIREVEAPCLHVPSARRQKESIETYLSLYPDLKNIYAEQGIDLKDDETGINAAESFSAADMPGMFDFMIGNNAVLVRINAENAALLEKIRSLKGVYPLDRRGEWSRAFGLYRQELIRMLVTALILITAGGMFIIGRDIIKAAAVPLVTGICAGITADILMTGSMNLFTAVALFVVTGLGADYCVFIYGMGRDSLRKSDTESAASSGTGGEKSVTDAGADSTPVTLFLSWISTEFSCGLLMFSEMPAIVTMGAVIFWGLLFIPVTALMLRKQPPYFVYNYVRNQDKTCQK